MDPLFEIELALAEKGSRRLSQTLYRQLKAAILDGRLSLGAKLPATRKSDAFFGVSRNTVVEVYEKLQHEGYVTTRHGSGTFVADTMAPAPVLPGSSTTNYTLNEFWLSPDMIAAMDFWQDRSQMLEPRSAAGLVDFRPNLIDSRLFPFETFRKATAKQLRGLEKKAARFKSAQGNQGNYFLREAVTRHIALTRAVVCRPDDIVVTSGAQQAFDLLARILITPNKTVVAIEDPGYPPMRVAFVAAGAKLVPAAVDAEGLIVDRLPPDAGVICVCPSHQFPLGVTMSPRRRKALIEFARRRGAVIVEDDYDGEFRYDGSPLEALRVSTNADVVFYVGTFSKCMLPALRLGFVVAPDWAMRTLVAAKNSLDWHCSTPLQMGVCEFIAGGHLARHVRKMREIYRKRRQLLLTSLQEDFGRWLEPVPSFYGMHVAATVCGQVDLEAVAHTLLRRNVKIHTLKRYYLGSPAINGLVFGYAAVDLPDIRRGLFALRQALLG
jgi:GntR family transcriptional regulator/MocR family aminotransferase